MKLSGSRIYILYVQNYSLVLLVRTAYQVRLEDVTGGPDWRESATYDIEAKSEQPVADDQTLFLMLRSLLAERFKLAIHREVRDVPIYALVTGKNGPKLRKVSDQNPAPAARDTAGAGGRGGCGPGTGVVYGTLQLGGDAAGARRVSGRASMSELAGFLSTLVRCRPVLDKTAIAGIFDINLEWRQTPPNDFPLPPSPLDPELASVIQDALGLRLEEQMGPGEVQVIDHAEKPSEN